MPNVEWVGAHDGNFSENGSNSREYIVVHNTGNTASAWEEAQYAHNDQHESSYHYVLDDGDTIYQLVHDYDTAWAVGAWPGYEQYIGNGQSISIEVCSNGDPFTDAEISNLRWMVHDLMDAYGIDADHVVRHYDCHSGHKDCPAAYVDDDAWHALRDAITGDEPQPEPEPVHVPSQPDSEPRNDNGFNYQAHVQDIGWCPCVRDGMVAGTVGESLRLEALHFGCPDGLTMGCKLHMQDVGWVDFPHIDGSTVVGTVGESRRIEAIEPYVISNTTGLTPKFSIHVQDYGWQGGYDFGNTAGSTGMGKRIEAVEFWLE